MKKAGHGEGMVHLLATVGFFGLCGLMLIAPNYVNTNAAIGILSGLIGLKTIGNLILDSHNKIHYHSKNCGDTGACDMQAKEKEMEGCCGGSCGC